MKAISIVILAAAPLALLGLYIYYRLERKTQLCTDCAFALWERMECKCTEEGNFCHHCGKYTAATWRRV